MNSLDQFLGLMKKGERSALVVPPSALSDRLPELTLRSLSRLEQKYSLCTSAPLFDLPGTIMPALLTSLADARNIPAATKAFSALLRKIPSTAVLVVDWRFTARWVRSTTDAISFLKKAGSEAARKGVRTVWLFRTDTIGPDLRAALGGFADYLLNVRNIGVQLYAQFLKARGVFDDDLFLPRRLRLTDNQVEFEAPSVPSFEAATAPAGEGGGAPVAVDVLDVSYRKVFESSPDGMILFDLKGYYREANPRALEMLGRDAAEFQAAALADLVGPNQVRSALKAAVALKRKGRITGEFEILRKSGRTIHVTISASLVDRGRYMAVLHDLSSMVKEADRLRDSAFYYQNLFSSSAYPQAVVAARKLVICNDAFRKTFGVPFEQNVEGKPLSEYLGRDISSFLRDIFGTDSRSRIGRSGVRRELVIASSGGPPLRFEVSAVPLADEEPRTYHITFVDITAHHQMVENASASEHRYRDLMETTAGAIAVVRDGKIVFVNQGFLSLFGYGSPGEIVGDEVNVITIQREKNDLVERCIPANALGGPSTSFLYTGVRKDGSLLQIQLTGETIVYEGQHSFLSYHHDVTDQKALDDQVRKKAHAYQILDDLSGILADTAAVAPLVQGVLEGLLRRLGYEAGGVYVLDDAGKAYRLVTQTGLSEKVQSALGEQPLSEGISGYVAKTHEPLILTTEDYPPFLPHRSLFESEQLSVIIVVPLMAGESARGMILLVARKRQGQQICDGEVLTSLGRQVGIALERAMEFEKLQAAEILSRSTLDGLVQVAYQTSPSGAFRYISPSVETLLGYKPSEFRNSDLWRSIVHPDDRTKYSLRVAAQHEGRESVEIEYRMYPKGKAASRWIRDSFRYTRNADGAVVSIQGIVTDLAGEQERLASLVAGLANNFQDAVVTYDTDLVCRSWNRAFAELAGLEASVMVGKTTAQAAAETGFGIEEDALHKALGGEKVVAKVSLAPDEDGKPRSVSLTLLPIRERDGSISGVSGVAAGPREGKRGPEEDETTSRLREVINAMGDALMISDLEWRIVEVNRAFTNLTGYERSEVQGLQFPYPWLIDEETPRFVQWISELREKRYLLDFDMTWRHKDGRATAISLNTTLFRNAAGEPVAMLNIARDISERRRLANELARRTRQVESLNRIVSKANRTVDFAEIFETIAFEVASLVPCHEIGVGLLTEDGKSLQIIARADDQGRGRPAIPPIPLDHTVSHLAIARRAGVVVGDILGHPELGSRAYSAREGFRSQLTIPIILNERVLGVLIVANRETNALNLEHLRLVQPVADQLGAMIDRSRLFQQVNEDSRYIHTLLNSLQSIVLTVDPDYRIREVNKAWREFADLQGLQQYREESSVVGIPIEEIVTLPPLREELRRVMPQFFDKTLSFYATEVAAGAGPEQKTYQLVINPMAVQDGVAGLVFTYTDITSVIRTEAEIRLRNEELMAFNAISASISRSLNLDDVLEVAFEQIRRRLNAEVVLCYLTEKDGPLLHLTRWAGVDDTAAGKIREIQIAPRHTPAPAGGWELLVLDENAGGDERVTDSVRGMVETLGKRPLIAIPLHSKNRLLGALVIGFADEHQARDHERRILLLLGNQLGSAMENAQLYAELQEQFSRTTTLYEVGKGLTGVHDTGSLFELVFREVSRSLPISEFRYELFLDRASMLRLVFRGERSADGTHTANEPEERALEPGGAEQTVVSTMVPHIGITPEHEPLIIVPVRRQRKLDGLISVRGPAGTAYSASYLRLVESIGNMVEIALDRVALYEDTVAKSHEIEARNRELDDFAYVVSHDLKEPLITIEGYSKIVLRDYKDRVNDEGLQFLSSIVQSSARMKNLIEDLLTLSRVGRVTDTVEVVQTGSVLSDVLRDIDFTLRQQSARVDVPADLPAVRYNATQLSMVFRNLITNAVKFNRSAEPAVEIGVKEEPSEFRFQVRDNGIGIAREHFERIFVIFQRLNRAEDYQGTGAGLTIVKKIVERHGGRIWLESEEGKGTTFYFTIPK